MSRSSLTPGERALRATMAAYKSWAQTHDVAARTAPGLAAAAKRFEDQVDPDRVLPEAERLRRAEAARRSYFVSLAFKSAKARRARAAGGDAA